MIKTQTVHFIVCDECEKLFNHLLSATEAGERHKIRDLFVGGNLAAEVERRDSATGKLWVRIGKKHYCQECRPKEGAPMEL